MKNAAIVLGAGSGTRMNAGINKIFLPLDGIPVIVYSVAAFTGFASNILVTAHPAELDQMKAVLHSFRLASHTTVIAGGNSRQESVRMALEALPADTDYVMIHDGARPFVNEEIIRNTLRSAAEKGSGIAAVPVVDTIKRAASDGKILEGLNRSELYAMQTPQTFRYAQIMEAHRKALRDSFEGTDDAALLERLGQAVYLSEGSPQNIKLTTPTDMAIAMQILQQRKEGN